MQIDIISDLKERKIQIKTEERKSGYGTELLYYAEVDGIVGPAELSVDGEVHYIFSFGEKITMSEYLKKEKLDEKKIVQLYRSLLKRMKEIEEYFLVPENLILCADYIFMDPLDELHLAYMDGYAADVADELAKITEEIMNVMDHNCRSLTFLVYGIHKVCREEHFTLNKLEHYLEQYHYEETEKVSAPCPAPERVKKEKIQKKKGKKTEWFLVGVVCIGAAWYMGWMDGVLISGAWYKVVGICCTIALLYCIWNLCIKKEKITEYGNLHNEVQLYLKPMNPSDPYIQIDHSPFYIGADERHVEGSILQKDVSEVHAKIVMEENDIYIIDQESEEGTSINKEKLIPWECHRLSDGDIVDISSHCYQAVVSECS